MIPQEIKNYIKGMYGRPPAPIDPKVQKLAIGDEQPIDCRPADLLEPGFEKAKEELGDLGRSDEDVVSYALFPPVAKAFFEKRAKGELHPELAIPKPQAAAPAAAPAVAAPAAAPAPRRVYSYSMWKLSGRVKK